MSSKILVVGHRNPDNDSIAAAVGYAHLKNALAARDGEADAVEYVPARLGPLPVESAWILEQKRHRRAGAHRKREPCRARWRGSQAEGHPRGSQRDRPGGPGYRERRCRRDHRPPSHRRCFHGQPHPLFEPPHRLHGHHRHASVPPDRHRAARFHRPRSPVGHPHRTRSS